jgi:hypothetical protein
MQNFKKRTPFFLNVYLPKNVDTDIVDNLQKMADFGRTFGSVAAEHRWPAQL